MNSDQIKALSRLSDRHVQSFSEATEVALDSLGQALPGTIILCQADAEENHCRVIDLRGPAVGDLERGSTLSPVMPFQGGNGTAPGDGSVDTFAEGALDPAVLRSRSIESCLAAPLEMSDGSIVGVLCAMAKHRAVYDSGDAAVLGITARFLSYEWERVQTRNELRRLEARVQDDGGTDPETGLATREAFVAALDREWRLAKRGNVESILVACRIKSEAPRDEFNEAMPALAIKDAAAALAGTARATDHVGRIGEASLAIVLVGCPSLEAAAAFLGRFQSALERTTTGRPFPVALSFGVHDLAQSASWSEALEQAEDKARESQTRSPGPDKARGASGG